MLLSLFFSSLSLFFIIGISLTLMILLTFLYGRDRKQRRLFWIAWMVFLGINSVGVSCIRSEAHHANQRITHLLNKMADHLAVSLRDIHAKIPAGPSEDDPEYRDALSLLSSWQNGIDEVAALFTLRKEKNGDYRFILSPALDTNQDGVVDGPMEEIDPPGTVYSVENESVLRNIEAAFKGENVMSGRPYRDEWGRWITAYRPLKNDDGRIAAVFGIDYWGDDWNRSILQARIWPSLFFYSFLFFFFLQLLYLVKQRNEEKNLRHYSRELEKIIDATEEIRCRLKTVNRNKRIFLENMCEELKTVIEPCLARIDELEIRCLGDTSSLFHELEMIFDGICREAGRVLTLLDSIDTYLRMNTEKVALRQEAFPVRSYLELLKHPVLSRLREKPNVSFEIAIDENVPETILIDHGRLGKVLLELLNNAVQRSESGAIRTRVSIWDSTMKNQGPDEEKKENRLPSTLSGELFLLDEESPLLDQLSYIKVVVDDEALKIPPDRISALFHPLSEPRTPFKKPRPVEFGLSMARSQARIAGGKLRWIDHDKLGNRFLLLIPVVVPHVVGSDRPTSSRPISFDSRSLEGYRVLIVDGNIANQIFIETLLNNAGAQTVSLGSGDEVVDLLLDERKAGRFFDLIVMDAHLSPPNGRDTKRSIRNHGFMRPIILTGGSFDKIGFPVSEWDAVLSKPIDGPLLLQTVLRLTHGKCRTEKWF